MESGHRIGVGVLLAAGLLAACGTMSNADESTSLDGTSWVLAGLPARSLVPGTSVTLQFADGRVSGSDGCNRYGGGYAATGTTLQLTSQLASTQMACPQEIMEQARVYVAALTGAISYRANGDRLELLGPDGATLATLAAVAQTLAGTSWRATGINNGRQAVVSVVNGSTVTMNFGADGTASGSAGCNRYSAPYKMDGRNITFGQAAVTRMMCAEPAGVMEQEQQFLNALSTVATSRIEGDRLELRTAEDALAAILVRQRAP
jgi:heat shock protein HslJ